MATNAGVPGEPTVFVVFGATGDLIGRKIIPSLYHLYTHERLPASFRVVGFSRRPMTDEEFHSYVLQRLRDKIDVDADDEQTLAFCDMFSYSAGTFEDEAAYAALGECLAGIDTDWGVCSNKLFYLAVAPRFYQVIFERLSASGLARPCSDAAGWTRVLVEKPFGKDEKTAEELDRLLATLFEEEQIYRIDHYLAKEMLQGVLDFRFSNSLFEPSWNRKAVESIQISLHESLGVEDRGNFFDGVGALRDVGQNHVLQMLALVTMDQPAGLEANAIRVKRGQLLRRLKPMTRMEVALDTYRAQYEGYRDIDGVADDSQTETYFKVKTVLDSPRWRGVPITLEGGKRIGGVRKEIVVTFRHAAPCLCDDDVHHHNRVIFTLEPQESIKIEFYTKRPGYERDTEKREFSFFLYEKKERAQYVEEYAHLLDDAIRGDQTLFVSTDEVDAMWEFVDPIVKAWSTGATPLQTYAPDTTEAPDAAARIDVATVRVSPVEREIGIMGLGKMGAGLARNWLENGWRVVGHNRTPAVAEQLAAEGLVPAYSPSELIEQLKRPRVVWLMLPAGRVTEEAIFGEGGFAGLLETGDVLIDGANSYFEDDIARAPKLLEREIRYLDVGVSGGPAGARDGACLMIGGDRETYEELGQLWHDLAVEGGFQFFDGVGAGHFVKMVHNGIEYGMMQAIAEGFAIMHASDYDPDLVRVADVYDHGSVIVARLITWLRQAYEHHGVDLEDISGTVGHTGEGEWTTKVARELGVPAPIIEGSFRFRLDSEDAPSYTGRILSALRNQFGGHEAAVPGGRGGAATKGGPPRDEAMT